MSKIQWWQRWDFELIFLNLFIAQMPNHFRIFYCPDVPLMEPPPNINNINNRQQKGLKENSM